MNWIKLSTDYPLAYKLMEDTFKCLYTASEEIPTGKKNETYDKKVTHPLKRDLYDFFDEQKLLISIYSLCSDKFICDVKLPNMIIPLYTMDANIAGGRPQAETKAFTNAFEILNDRLTKK